MDVGQAQDVMDSLALMPDPALQQYALMHKDDPYVMSLAMSESNRRKKLRAAQQGQAGQMPQPKVIDQAIAAINSPPMMPQQGMPQGAPQQLLPEQQGIARLPAPNMQAMADGGIAGYAGGGDVEYKYVRDASGRVVRVPVDKTEKKPGLMDLAQQVWEYSNRNANNPAAMAPTAPPPPAAPPPPPAPAGIPRSAGPSMGPGNMQPPPPPPPPPRAPAAGPAGDVSVPGLSVANLQKQAGIDEGKLQAYLSGARNDLASRLPADAEANKDLAYFVAQRKAQMPEGEAYDKYQASLEKEEAAEPEEKEKAGLLALTKGFLAMASGESPHAMINMAKGLGIGLEDYASSIKEFRKAGKERQKQLGDIEQARRAEKRGDVDKAAEYMEKAKEREGRRQTTLASGMAQLDAAGAHGIVSLMGDTLRGGYSLLGTQMQGQNQLAYAREMANAPSAQEKHIRSAMADRAYEAMATKLATAAPDVRGEFAQNKYWNSMEGQMALRMMEASKDPDDQVRAKAIKAQLKASNLPNAVNVNNALP